jgi:hypothetical protein
MEAEGNMKLTKAEIAMLKESLESTTFETERRITNSEK